MTDKNKPKYKQVWVGDIAAVVGIIALIPLVWYVMETQQVRDLHMGWMLLKIIATLCWLYFGIVNKIQPNIISSSCILAILLFLLGMKIYVSNKNSG